MTAKPGPSLEKAKGSSTESVDSFKEENFVESLMTQVDEEAIMEVINVQKKSLERFEKTNEMLLTCRQLTEKRLEEVKKQFTQATQTIQQAKADLESVFRRLKAIKQVLAEKNPKIYAKQVEEAEKQFPPEPED
ncbi:unnamed protein product [Bursaphelenchus xylophilus]|uniref:(pine wood nematode) hypothetical protein n=1 Tax=Bursaphelenchus xylophilus TaxID=6326 RepID=A0A1I7RWZ3_BURXY|nr:unnamed protein product [Bursaphelenchus xylophilus]CAG9121217.1 unnamed protein product [Bursaphelenchus xylophilus]